MMVQPRALSFASAHATIPPLLSKQALTLSTTSLNLAHGPLNEGLDSASEMGNFSGALSKPEFAAIVCEHGHDVSKRAAETLTGNPVSGAMLVSCTNAALLGTKAGASTEKDHGNLVVLGNSCAISGAMGGMVFATLRCLASRCGDATGAFSGMGTSSAGICTTSSNAAKDTYLACVVGELSRVLRPVQLGILKQPVLHCDSSPESSSESPPRANDICFTDDLGKFSGVLRPMVLGVAT
mmetsp:Transcript_61012/g.154053  ORF Transcript_61012/g.154053 Transcript_61012/m.154053 type:complete len:239 (-) Transcript_61012:468-1184(-)